MTISVQDKKTQATAAATAWWAGRPFPNAPWGRPYLCDTCGAPIDTQDGTALVDGHLECAACTDRLFPPEQAPPPEQAAPPEPPPPPTWAKSTWTPSAPPLAPPTAPPVPPPSAPPTAPLMAPPPTAPPPTAPPPVRPPKQPLSPAARRRRRRLLLVALVLAAVGALVAGLFVWAPWVKPAPHAPTAVQKVSATATTIGIGWTPGAGGPKVDRFIVQRDGVEVGTVAGAVTTYVDKDLKPGVSHAYTVIAETGSRRSAASPPQTYTTNTPSPVDLKPGAKTTTSLTFSWSGAPDAPAPDTYEIYDADESTKLGDVPGTTTTYQAKNLTPGTSYSFQVDAVWGGHTSPMSDSLDMTTLTPPVSAARLVGSFDVHFKVTAVGGGNIKTGDAWVNTWEFSPRCGSGPCSVTVTGTIAPSGYTTHTFKATLARQPGGVYTGTTRAHISHCGSPGAQADITDTLTFRLTVKGGQVDGTSWVVSSWAGTMQMDSPYTTAPGGYCPAQSMTTTLSAS